MVYIHVVHREVNEWFKSNWVVQSWHASHWEVL